MYEEIIYEVEEPVATITINRPARLNALTARTQVEIKHAMIAAERDERVVGIILTGAGRAFSAGADMRSLAEIAERRAVDQDETLAQLEAECRGREVDPEFRVTWSFIPSLKKPVIAAVNGPCAGMSTAIATMCDLRFASDSAVFTTSFSQRGLVAEHGLSWILPRLIGPAKALDLLWSARRVDAQEAERLGLVDRVVPDDELLPTTRGYIEDLARNSSPASIMIMKRQVYLHLMKPLHEAMEETNRLMAESLTGDDFREGVASFVEKRAPAFPRV
ncbi:MAG: enoyl-CoA hydratase [Chloroflexi bacterium]|nr:MAG: enoyl-CoA hydratase [Chloroflexota bacterium]